MKNIRMNSKEPEKVPHARTNGAHTLHGLIDKKIY